MNIKYDRVVCINLDKRPEKWQAFLEGLPADFPFGAVERYPAIDGTKVKRPDWWRGGGGAWGCYLSHRRIIEECLNQGLKSVLILEDDALFLPDFTAKVNEFHDHLPSDAQWLYYGGQHLRKDVQRPEKVNEYVFRPYNVNRTHAYGIIGTDAMIEIEKHISRKDWTTPNHIDHHFGRLHQKKELKVYCPAYWLVDQREGRSDVAFREKGYQHWGDASTVPDVKSEPFYAVVGCHSSGSSAVAGILYHLGIHLGNVLTGAHGQPPIKGGEAIDLQRLFETAAPVPTTEWKISIKQITDRLRQFTNRRRLEAIHKQTFAAGKYPQMGATGVILPEMLGDQLRLVICDRMFDQSVKSLHSRFSSVDAAAIEAHQKWIANGIVKMRECVAPENQIVINYDEMISAPEKVVSQIIQFMGIEPTESMKKRAIKYIKPEMRHFTW